MMKTLFVSIIFLCSLQAKNYIDIYRHDGIQKVKNIFDNLLESTKYWDSYLKDYNTTYGYYEKEKYIILGNKTHKDMKVYHVLANGKLIKVFSKNIILGKDGEKKREGDLITPIGVYKITMRFKPKDTFYGPVAFSLSYPNLLDRLEGRDGHGIWIHGYPLDNEKRAPVTKGCLVLKNSQLIDLSNTINPQESFVIIYENKAPIIQKKDLAKILSFLYRWKEAWTNSNLDAYLSFYSKDFKRYNGQDFDSFSNEKRRIFSKKQQKNIIFKYISIMPYPNIKNKKFFEIRFYEIYNTKSYKFKGNKELFVKLSDKIKIIAEQ